MKSYLVRWTPLHTSHTVSNQTFEPFTSAFTIRNLLSPKICAAKCKCAWFKNTLSSCMACDCCQLPVKITAIRICAIRILYHPLLQCQPVAAHAAGGNACPHPSCEVCRHLSLQTLTSCYGCCHFLVSMKQCREHSLQIDAFVMKC